MDEETNIKVKEHEIQTKEWRFSKLANELYEWFDRFNESFFEKQLKTPVISFEQSGVRNLGHFVLNRNAIGVKWNININSRYICYPLMDTLATLLHEMIHQWQQEFGNRKAKTRRNNYHDKEFRLIAHTIGIPSNERGAGIGYYDPFLSLLNQFGVDIESKLTADPDGNIVPIWVKGNSKLKKWSCSCTNVRVAVDDFRAVCLKCHTLFKLNERL
jgi:hypothetical protein